MSLEQNNFSDLIEKITHTNTRYHKGAYFFVKEALEYTVKNQAVKAGKLKNNPHIDGKTLLNGIKDYALLQYGPMTMELFKTWNIKTCQDFGKIVFTLVDYGILGKTEEDSIEDFKDGYDFYEVFEKPFLPHE